MQTKHFFYSLSFASLLAFTACGKKSGYEVRTAEVEKRTITETVSASGKIQPEVELKLSADVSGEIIELNLREGDPVQKGDLLVKINPDLVEAALNRAQAAVEQAKANRSNATARVKQTEARLTFEKNNFERNKKLHGSQAISDADFESIEANYLAAKADLEAAQETENASKHSVRSAEASLKEARDNLNRTSIYATMDGTISKMNMELGERVVGTQQMQGTEILRIADLNNMEVEVEVNENDIVKVSIGDTADVEVDAYLNRTFKGLVTEIANSATVDFKQSSMDQVTNYYVKIRILRSSYQDLLVDENSVPFRPGMSANVDIRTATVQDVLCVPIEAVTSRPELDTTLTRSEQRKRRKNADTPKEFCVFVVDGRKAEQRKVVQGIQDSKYIQIKTGVQPGEQIVTGPYKTVSNTLEHGKALQLKRKPKAKAEKE